MKLLASCLVTIAIAVPAGWHALDADIQADGPGLRPERQTATIGDATVAFDLDRGVMLEGDTISAMLVATSDRPHHVAVEVSALQDMGYGGERVPNPPVLAGRRTVTLEARPGGGPPIVASFKLGTRRAVKGSFSWFDIEVRGAGKTTGETAKSSVVAWGGNSFAISIEPPAKIPAKGPFTVAVRIKNTTNQPLGDVDVQLGTQLGLEGLSSRIYVQHEGIELVEPAGEQAHAVAPGAEKLVIFKVSDDARHFTFVALADDAPGEAMEVKSFDRAAPDEVAPSPVAAR